MGRGAMAFADFDNDNDLDLIMSGQDNVFLPMGKIYQNTDGSFSEVTTNFKGLYNSAMSVADYDHDGLFDVIITGQNVYDNKTYLFRNTGNFQFQLADSTLYGAGANGDVAFGDYNNDGFADILLAGNYQAKLYYNDGNGSFTDTGAALPGMGFCSVAWGDYDNDGDKDILMAGDDGSTMTHIIENNFGSFNAVFSADGAISGDACWGDHDMDGYLDFMFSGKDYNLVAVTTIYRNNADGTFTNANAGFVGTALGRLTGYYNNRCRG
ncbi:MAG TPA: VCBS repeat-containing protein [Bacteroidales bacterium]|nr:VCBS repeat-containing protein [Bacteroidales bacterium]